MNHVDTVKVIPVQCIVNILPGGLADHIICIMNLLDLNKYQCKKYAAVHVRSFLKHPSNLVIVRDSLGCIILISSFMNIQYLLCRGGRSEETKARECFFKNG